MQLIIFVFLTIHLAQHIQAAKTAGIQCTPTNISRCNHTSTCRACPPNSGPTCSQATCVNGQCSIIVACSITLTTTVKTTMSKNATYTANECTPTNVTRCNHMQLCATCLSNYGPRCTEVVCENGRCKILPFCRFPITTTKSASKNLTSSTSTARMNTTSMRKIQQCTSTDISRCNHSSTCKRCPPGFEPHCSKAICDDGQCKIIPACSIPVTTPRSSLLTSTSQRKCSQDKDCAHPEYCVSRCSVGTAPLCVTARCTNGSCQTITPCSLKEECTSTNKSRCIKPNRCRHCGNGTSPPCADVSCAMGLCQIIEPCSIITTSKVNSSIGTTTPLRIECNKDNDCKTSTVCVPACGYGRSPLCAIAKCVNNRCVTITPCSEMAKCTENNVSQCPVPPRCMRCERGQGPHCSQAKCFNGECQLIEPCSLKRCLSAFSCPAKVTNCMVCPRGYGPKCERAVCERYICGIIKPCSLKLVRR